jgi:hypothetical protein
MLKRFFSNFRMMFSSPPALDDYRDSSTQQPQDRPTYARKEMVTQAFEAWQQNPLARRIVELQSSYVIGAGISFTSKEKKVLDALNAFWYHSLNQMDMRIYTWIDELTRSGDLFVLFSVDAAGFAFVRALPSVSVQSIETSDKDLEQEKFIKLYPTLEDSQGKKYFAYQKGKPQKYFYKHYSINRPVGALFGEGDLPPLLKWISRYSTWLEDRARLNRYRNSFLFVVKAKVSGETARLDRQRALNAAPPNPGSILVVDDSEEWEVLSPKLESSDANEDGLALKKMVAGGAGIPLHFIAEPETSNRSTAESAGGPTFRHYEARQRQFAAILKDVCLTILEIKKITTVPGDVEIITSDLSSRDNAALALSSIEVVNAFGDLRDRGLIDDEEYLRICYRFAGEVIDVKDMLARGGKMGAVKTLNPDKSKPDAQAGSTTGKVSRDTGNVSQPGEKR